MSTEFCPWCHMGNDDVEEWRKKIPTTALEDRVRAWAKKAQETKEQLHLDPQQALLILDQLVTAKHALRDLVMYKPGFPSNIKLAYSYAKADAARERREADDAPLCSEAYTYNLWGKEEARTFLHLIDQLARALGFPMGARELWATIEEQDQNSP